MAKAGTREREFIDFCNKIDNKLLSRKISFTDKEYRESTEKGTVWQRNTGSLDPTR